MHESVFHLDSTKIKKYMDCPRSFFYRHVLGWTPEQHKGEYHLVFGRALHVALEHLLKTGMNKDEIDKAYQLFLEDYRSNPEFTPETDSLREPKTPDRAYQALIGYVERYGEEDKDLELLHSEISGSVPITEDINILFRVDAIVKGDNGIFVLEHKTGSRLSQSWIDQWALSVQVGLYMHLLMSMYDPKDVWGAKINGIFLYKSKAPEFYRVPIKMNVRWLNQWRLNMISWVKSIYEDINYFIQEKEAGVRVMESFRMNTESCTKYYGCPYRDLCISWENPLDHADEPPVGFEIDWWDPRDMDKFSDNSSKEYNIQSLIIKL